MIDFFRIDIKKKFWVQMLQKYVRNTGKEEKS